jgi:hypothetical protein
MSERHIDFCEQVEMYSIGGLSLEEIKSFEEHLSNCEDCTKQLEELRDIVGLLPLTSDQVNPPEGMKQRVLGRILDTEVSQVERNKDADQGTKVYPDEIDNGRMASRRKGKNRFFNRIVLSGLSAAVFILGIYSYQLTQNVQQLEFELADMRGPVSGPMQPSEVVKLNPAAEGIVSQGLATIVVDQRGTHLLVQAENLPKLEGTEAYQVWLLKDSQPQNAGTFLAQAGTGALYLTFEPQDYDTVAITLEPDAFGDQPRGEPILVASLMN